MDLKSEIRKQFLKSEFYRPLLYCNDELTFRYFTVYQLNGTDSDIQSIFRAPNDRHNEANISTGAGTSNEPASTSSTR